MKKQVGRFDFRPLEKPVKTDQGFLRVPVLATRSGVFTYRRSDGSILKELRPPEEVFNEESMKTLSGIPLTNRHPTSLVDAKNAKKFMVGFVSDFVEREGDYLKTFVTITDQSTIDEVEKNGLREVSCGYVCDLEESEGKHDGEEFQLVQRNIKYNHLALVDKGRAGPEARLRLDEGDAILDENETGLSAQTTKTKGVSVAKITLNGVDFEASEALASAVQTALDKANSTIDSLKKSKDEMGEKMKASKEEKEKKDAKIDALETELKEAKEAKLDSKQIHELVKHRQALVNVAEKVLDKDTKLDEMDDAEIKKAVVAKKCPELKLDEKSEVYVEARFDHICETLETEKTDSKDEEKTDPVKEALKQKQTKTDKVETFEEKRARIQKADAEAWKQPLSATKKQIVVQ